MKDLGPCKDNLRQCIKYNNAKGKTGLLQSLQNECPQSIVLTACGKTSSKHISQVKGCAKRTGSLLLQAQIEEACNGRPASENSLSLPFSAKFPQSLSTSHRSWISKVRACCCFMPSISATFFMSLACSVKAIHRTKFSTL